MRLLVVDDDEDIREVAQLCLETTGDWQVLTASSGTEAIATARTEQPDAILMDVMMPEMDGLSTFRELQGDKTTRTIPVILLTAKVQAADRGRFAELGVTGVIPKPFDPMTLAGQVTEILRQSSES